MQQTDRNEKTGDQKMEKAMQRITVKEQNTVIIQGETVLQNRMTQIQKMKIIRKII